MPNPSRTIQGNSPNASLPWANLFGLNDRSQHQIRDWEIKINQTRDLVATRKFSEALKMVVGCLDVAQSLFGQDPKPKITCHLLSGLSYHGLARYKPALGSFRSALDLCDDLPTNQHTRIILLGNVGSALSSLGQRNESIDAYSARLDILQKTSYLERPLVNTLTVETLKELSALCLASKRIEEAEMFSFKLASLQERGIERGKTLLILAQIYRAMGQDKCARNTAKMAKTELIEGAAEHYEPLVLANSYSLEGRLLLERRSPVAARDRYSKAHALLKNVLGEYHFRSLLCECDVAVVDMYRGRSLEALKVLGRRLDMAIQLSDTGSNDPIVRPYLLAHANLNYLVGSQFQLALKRVSELKKDDVNLISVDKSLDNPQFKHVWAEVFEKFIRGIDRGELIQWFDQRINAAFNTALSRYTQVLSSLQMQFGKQHLDIAAIYDCLSSVHRALKNHNLADRCDQQAAIIRKANE